MRDGWEVKPLGDLCKIQLGKTPHRKNEKFWDKEKITNNIWLSIADMKHGLYINNSKEYVSDLGAKNGNLVPHGTLMLSFKLTLGRVSFAGCDLLTNEAIASLIELDENISKKFLFYYFTFFNWNVATEGDQKVKGRTLNKKKLSLLPIILPPLTEQKQIVKTLDLAFKQIDQAKANLEKNLNNAKELFQSKLNEVFSQRGEGWEEKRLGDVCSLYQGLAINKKTKHLLVEKSSLPLLRIKDLRNNTHEQYISEIGFPENSFVSEEEIIYTRTGNSLGLVFRGRRGILHNNSFKIIPKELLTNDYLFWWLQHEAFTKIVISLASKAAQPDITHKLFKEQIISIPSIELQNRYYDEIEKLNQHIIELKTHYQHKLNNLEELKKSILEKAFKGEL